MKGFTLIELIAVIVILGILLLITVPIISGVVEGVKKDTFEANIAFALKAAREDYMNRNMFGDIQKVTYRFDDYVQTVTPSTVKNIAFKGDGIKNGSIIVYKDGTIKMNVTDDLFFVNTNSEEELNKVVMYDYDTHYPLLYPKPEWTFEVTIPEGSLDFVFNANTANLNIDWGDNIKVNFSGTGNPSHTYTSAGKYAVTLVGTAKKITFCEGYTCTAATSTKLTDILTEIPADFGITDASFMFANTNIVKFSALNFFDEASKNVTNFFGMFYNAKNFNHPIGNWNTSNATSFGAMFRNAESFNQSLENWNTGKLQSISYMFNNAKSFNQPINFDTTNVTSMDYLFSGATVFNQPIAFNTAKVTSMNSMFSGAKAFNQSILTFNTSKVTNMDSMFSGATAFDQPLSHFDTSKVTNMQWMFLSASNFNQPIGNWNTSLVTTMSLMFSNATKFNQNISNWNTSNVTTMDSMFHSARMFNQDISNWNTSKVTNMNWMFGGSSSGWNIFNQDISNWDTSNVTGMMGMFVNNTSFNQNLSSWCVSKIASKPSNFDAGATAWTLSKPIWGTCN